MGQNITGTIVTYSTFGEFVSNVVTPYSIPFSIPGAQGSAASSVNYTNGTGALQLDTCYSLLGSLASTTLTIDFTSLTDPNGNAINFARIREFLLYVTSTTAGFDLKVEQGASNGWAFVPPSTAPQIVRANGGFYRISDPNSTGAGNGNVVGASSKTVKFDSGSNTVTFLFLAVGTSVA